MPRPHFTSPFGRRHTPTTANATSQPSSWIESTDDAAADADAMDSTCASCRRAYDAGKRRRTTDASCGHVRCRACTRDRKRPCQQCAAAEQAPCRPADLHGTLIYHSWSRHFCIFCIAVYRSRLETHLFNTPFTRSSKRRASSTS